jgi:ribose-phosphate pyrophosphokinase
VLVDDIVASAGTMIETVKHLRAAGLSPPVCVAIHGIFAGDALADLDSAGAGPVVSTNTILHVTNAIDVSGSVSDCVREFSGSARTA